MFDEEYIINLLQRCDFNDTKIAYMRRKYAKYGVDKFSLSEYNYIRAKNNLEILDIYKLRDCLYQNMVSYSDIQSHTKISRAMMCMILRGTRNCTIKQIKKILKYLDNLNIKFTF